VNAEDARTIGRRLRQIRKSRGKSLVVIAGLAGMSKSQLDRIERGEVALDKISEIVALATALQIAPSDLTRLPVPAPANGHTDSTTDEVRLALLAVSGHGATRWAGSCVAWPTGPACRCNPFEECSRGRDTRFCHSASL